MRGSEPPPAGPGATVSVEGTIVRVVLKGEVTEALSAAAVAQAVQAASKAGSARVLFDIRAATHPGYHASVLKRADEAPASGIARFRVAILGEAGNPMLEFIADVANNRGVMARCFTVGAQAIAWLG